MSTKKTNKLKKELNHEVDAIRKIKDNTKNLTNTDSDLKLIEQIKKMYVPSYKYGSKTVQFYYNSKIKFSIDDDDKNYVKTL